MRNGIIADNYRRAGAPYKIVFGLTLPQIVEIAATLSPDADVARWLRDNTTTRESVLLAPMLYPRERMTPAEAAEWIESSPTVEAIDILCHRLLRHVPEAVDIALAAAGSPRDLTRYAALRLLMNLFPASADTLEPLAREELKRECALTRPLALMAIDEIDFFRTA